MILRFPCPHSPVRSDLRSRPGTLAVAGRPVFLHLFLKKGMGQTKYPSSSRFPPHSHDHPLRSLRSRLSRHASRGSHPSPSPTGPSSSGTRVSIPKIRRTLRATTSVRQLPPCRMDGSWPRGFPLRPNARSHSGSCSPFPPMRPHLGRTDDPAGLREARPTLIRPCSSQKGDLSSFSPRSIRTRRLLPPQRRLREDLDPNQ